TMKKKVFTAEDRRHGCPYASSAAPPPSHGLSCRRGPRHGCRPARPLRPGARRGRLRRARGTARADGPGRLPAAAARHPTRPHPPRDPFRPPSLVLAGKRAPVPPPDRPASGLHGAARRVALRLLRGEARRRRREARSALSSPGAGPSEPLEELSARELLLIFD